MVSVSLPVPPHVPRTLNMERLGKLDSIDLTTSGFHGFSGSSPLQLLSRLVDLTRVPALTSRRAMFFSPKRTPEEAPSADDGSERAWNLGSPSAWTPAAFLVFPFSPNPLGPSLLDDPEALGSWAE